MKQALRFFAGRRLVPAVEEFREGLIRQALEASHGNQTKAAEQLGIHRNTLSRALIAPGYTKRAYRKGNTLNKGNEAWQALSK